MANVGLVGPALGAVALMVAGGLVYVVLTAWAASARHHEATAVPRGPLYGSPALWKALAGLLAAALLAALWLAILRVLVLAGGRWA